MRKLPSRASSMVAEPRTNAGAWRNVSRAVCAFFLVANTSPVVSIFVGDLRALKMALERVTSKTEDVTRDVDRVGKN